MIHSSILREALLLLAGISNPLKTYSQYASNARLGQGLQICVRDGQSSGTSGDNSEGLVLPKLSFHLGVSYSNGMLTPFQDTVYY